MIATVLRVCLTEIWLFCVAGELLPHFAAWGLERAAAAPGKLAPQT